MAFIILALQRHTGRLKIFKEVLASFPTIWIIRVVEGEAPNR